MCSAVSYLRNKKISHRDIKPENILWNKVNQQIVFKLTDFGSAVP